MTVQFSTAPTDCFCTTWGNKINKRLHFYPTSPVWVFPGSAEADISQVITTFNVWKSKTNTNQYQQATVYDRNSSGNVMSCIAVGTTITL